MSAKHKAERHDAIAYRILLGGELVGFALQMANGTWGAYDPDDKPLTRRHFKGAKQVAAWFDEQPAPLPLAGG